VQGRLAFGRCLEKLLPHCNNKNSNRNVDYENVKKQIFLNKKYEEVVGQKNNNTTIVIKK